MQIGMSVINQEQNGKHSDEADFYLIWICPVCKTVCLAQEHVIHTNDSCFWCCHIDSSTIMSSIFAYACIYVLLCICDIVVCVFSTKLNEVKFQMWKSIFSVFEIKN